VVEKQKIVSEFRQVGRALGRKGPTRRGGEAFRTTQDGKKTKEWWPERKSILIKGNTLHGKKVHWRKGLAEKNE